MKLRRKDIMRIIMIILYVILTVSGLILMKKGGNAGQITTGGGEFGFTISWISAIGFLCYIISFLLWQKLLVTFDLSYIVPIATGIVQVIVLLMGIFVFKEQINAMGIIGSIMIIIGIVLLAFGKR